MRLFSSDKKKFLSILKKSDLMDEVWYRNTYTDVAASGMNSTVHYLNYGATEGRNPGPLFDTNFYNRSNPDVVAAGINPLVHYVLHGRDEGRRPLGFYLDVEFYTKLYPEAASFPNGPLAHYQEIGRHERYYSNFDEQWYLEEYPQLRFFEGSLKQHFIDHGQYEGRLPAFDERWYREEYENVSAYQIDPIEHYKLFGKRMGLHPAFDRNFYSRINHDVTATGAAPYDHYNLHGRHEGRAPAFNRYWYKNFYKDLATLATDPFDHYVNHGLKERRLISFTDRMRITEWGAQNASIDISSPTQSNWSAPEFLAVFKPKVTVIVPNFNHAPYLRERLDSIYNQTYKNIEVILFDDASIDNSIEILSEYAQRYPDITTCVFNEKNSGGVFHQWKRGFELATGDLIWIAESDDYCSLDFLAELTQLFRNNAVMLAFSRSDFVQNGNCIWTTEAYWSEINFELATSAVIMPAHEVVQRAWGARNIAPNVSSVLFRNPGHLAVFDDPEWQRLRMCGDWILYLSIIRGGAIGYSPNVTNYYRQHPQNTSISTHDKDVYYEEHEAVARYLARNYAVDASTIIFHEEVLYRHWCMKRGTDSRAQFEHLFNLRKVLNERDKRKTNVAIAVYAIVTGGGETFPILLANLLHERGHSVTLVNFHMEKTNSLIRDSLNRAIPIVEPDRSADAGDLLHQLGVEVVHSHHGWADISLAFALQKYPHIAHVVTTHGFYEVMNPYDVRRYENVLSSIEEFVYIADKNLVPFSNIFKAKQSFNKITNTVALSPLTPLSRAELGVTEADFVICLASRAVAEKGWDEAIAAVKLANERSDRRIFLLLVGDGPEYLRLKEMALPSSIVLLGFQSKVRDYFAIADLGLIASRFRGESCPLVLIECLSVGKPVLSTNIGDVPNMLMSADGMAGIVQDLVDWKVDIEVMANEIARLANDGAYYSQAYNNVNSAMEKFAPDVVLDKYIETYDRALLKAKDTKQRRVSLSVVLVTYNMSRELPRTLYTLSPEQQGMEHSLYEVIVVDNGSSCQYNHEQLTSVCSNVKFYQMENPSASPVDALNFGIELAAGEVICAFIDAARMASPNLLEMGLEACEINERAVVGSLSFHLGHEPQNVSVHKGYNQVAEDALLDSVDWRDNGYKLFEISSYDPSSRFGIDACPAETNSLFLRRAIWAEIGGFDPSFKGRGGGLANLDIWRRLCEDERNVLVTLTGEGTFHQFHGGVATNAVEDVWEELHAEYVSLRGTDYRIPTKRPYHFGKWNRWFYEFQERQLKNAAKTAAAKDKNISFS